MSCQRRVGLKRFLRRNNGAHGGGGDFGLLFDQGIGDRQRRKIIAMCAGRSVAPAKVEMQLCNARFFGERQPHAVAPEPIGMVLLDGRYTITAVPLGRGRQALDDANLVMVHVETGLHEHVAQGRARKGEGRGDAQALQRHDVAARNVEVLAHAHEPIRVLRERAEQFGALPGREGARRGKRRPAKEMDAAVAQLLGPMLGAVLRHEFNINPVLLEETEFDRRRCHEIGGGIHVRDHEPICSHLCPHCAVHRIRVDD